MRIHSIVAHICNQVRQNAWLNVSAVYTYIVSCAAQLKHFVTHFVSLDSKCEHIRHVSKIGLDTTSFIDESTSSSATTWNCYSDWLQSRTSQASGHSRHDVCSLMICDNCHSCISTINTNTVHESHGFLKSEAKSACNNIKFTYWESGEWFEFQNYNTYQQ